MWCGAVCVRPAVPPRPAGWRGWAGGACWSCSGPPASDLCPLHPLACAAASRAVPPSSRMTSTRCMGECGAGRGGEGEKEPFLQSWLLTVCRTAAPLILRPLTPTAPHLSPPLALALPAASTSRPPRGTTPRSARCGPRREASTLRGAPAGTPGPPSRWGGGGRRGGWLGGGAGGQPASSKAVLQCRRCSAPVPTPAARHHSSSCLPVVQGMAGDKAKLEFVRAYYEFLPKSLYTDTRP